MNVSILLLITIGLLLFIGCQDSGDQPTTTDVLTSTGTIVERSAQVYLIESDAPNQYGVKTFYPINLTSDFRHNGLRVLFSGKAEVDPATMYAYLPFRLSFIQTIQESKGR